MKIKILLTIYFIFIFLLFLHPVNSGDFFHHLNTGKYIAENLKLPYQDFWTFTAEGKLWVAHSWGSGLVYYLIYKLLGYGGVCFFIALIGFLTCFLLYLSLKRLQIKQKIIICFTFLTAALISLRWPSRPEVLAPFFSISLLYLLILFKQLTYWHILLFWFWGIFYGSSAIFGLIITGLYLMSYRTLTKKNLIFFLFCIVASLLNSYGLRSLFYIFQIPKIAFYVGEWLPAVSALNPKIPGLVLFYQYPIFLYGLFFIFFTTIFTLGVIKHSKNLTENPFFVIIGLSLFLPFFSVRFLNLSPLLAIFLLAIIINRFSRRIINFFILLIALLGIVSVWVRFNNFGFGIGLDETIFPIRLTSFIRSKNLTGNIFANQEIGAFLTFELPKTKAFIDTRDDLFLPTNIIKDLNDLNSGRLDIMQILDKYQADMVVGDLGNGAIYKPLFYNHKWVLVYLTDGYFIQMKKNEAEKYNLKFFESVDPLRIPPAKPGELDKAVSEMEEILSLDTQSLENKVRLAELKLTQGKTEEAIKIVTSQDLLAGFHAANRIMLRVQSKELLGKIYLAAKKCDMAYFFLNEAQKDRKGKFIFFPKLDIPSRVDRYLADYYWVCKGEKERAKLLFSKYLQEIKDPLEIHEIEQKLQKLQ
jgi:hypothetical protein